MESSSAPTIVTGSVAKLGPYQVDLEPGSYYFCTCGLSKNQPFCDGSHKGSGMKSKKVEITKKDTYWVCGCKQTSDPNFFCDGTHNKAEVAQKFNKQLLQANTKLRDEVAGLKRDLTWTMSFSAIALAFAATIYFGRFNK